MAVKKSSCPFKKENIPCDGRAHIGKITNYQTQIVTYFIGCNKFKQNEKWHRFININSEEINLSLLQQLFSGTAPVSIS